MTLRISSSLRMHQLWWQPHQNNSQHLQPPSFTGSMLPTSQNQPSQISLIPTTGINWLGTFPSLKYLTISERTLIPGASRGYLLSTYPIQLALAHYPQSPSLSVQDGNNKRRILHWPIYLSIFSYIQTITSNKSQSHNQPQGPPQLNPKFLSPLLPHFLLRSRYDPELSLEPKYYRIRKPTDPKYRPTTKPTSNLPSRKTYLQSPSSRTFKHTPHQQTERNRV